MEKPYAVESIEKNSFSKKKQGCKEKILDTCGGILYHGKGDNRKTERACLLWIRFLKKAFCMIFTVTF